MTHIADNILFAVDTSQCNVVGAGSTSPYVLGEMDREGRTKWTMPFEADSVLAVAAHPDDSFHMVWTNGTASFMVSWFDADHHFQYQIMVEGATAGPVVQLTRHGYLITAVSSGLVRLTDAASTVTTMDGSKLMENGAVESGIALRLTREGILQDMEWIIASPQSGTIRSFGSLWTFDDSELFFVGHLEGPTVTSSDERMYRPPGAIILERSQGGVHSVTTFDGLQEANSFVSANVDSLDAEPTFHVVGHQAASAARVVDRDGRESSFNSHQGEPLWASLDKNLRTTWAKELSLGGPSPTYVGQSAPDELVATFEMDQQHRIAFFDLDGRLKEIVRVAVALEGISIQDASGRLVGQGRIPGVDVPGQQFEPIVFGVVILDRASL